MTYPHGSTNLTDFRMLLVLADIVGEAVGWGDGKDWVVLKL